MLWVDLCPSKRCEFQTPVTVNVTSGYGVFANDHGKAIMVSPNPLWPWSCGRFGHRETCTQGEFHMNIKSYISDTFMSQRVSKIVSIYNQKLAESHETDSSLQPSEETNHRSQISKPPELWDSTFLLKLPSSWYFVTVTQAN